MSEYQYYEFRAVDRPLDEREIRELRELPTRAEITATGFVNTYNWGDFRGDPYELMEKYVTQRRSASPGSPKEARRFTVTSRAT